MSFQGPIWEGVYQSFTEAPAERTFYNTEAWIGNAIARVEVLRKLHRENRTVRHTCQYRDSLLPLLAALVADDRQRVRILDFGGNTGVLFYPVLDAVRQGTTVEFHVVEVPEVCAAGRRFFSGEPGIAFHETLPEDSFDIVHLGSSLQYLERWQDTLRSLCAYRAPHLAFTDLVAGDIPTYVTIQHYYGHTMPRWFFSIHEVMEIVDAAGYRRVTQSVYPARVLGREDGLPQDHFPEQYRLGHSCNLYYRLPQ